MKILQSVRKYYEMLGINPSRSIPFNLKNVMALVSLAYGSILMAMCGISEAKSVADCVLSFYVFVTETALLIHVSIVIWNIESIAKLIESFEGFISNSKYVYFVKSI